ncbi:ArsR/SmtB family transcription factor [Nocardioides sp. MH1]|uniref:ArsR/SmtB family transcription factor n=1 Tax=Nocardioides sp. MH1 TaxID=3242490 RepID=UPI0035227110
MRRLTDPRELAALAHPVRIGILELLSLEGAQTATELAERLGESPANCSWHLRKLAEHDFVQETGDGHGRRRPWRVTELGLSWDSEAAPTLADHQLSVSLSEMMLERNLDRLHAARLRAPEEPPEWRSAMDVTTSASWLTDEELAARNEEINAILMRDLDRLTDPSKRPEGARLCEFVAWGVPVTFGEPAS